MEVRASSGARTFGANAAKLCAVPCDTPVVVGQLGGAVSTTRLPRVELAIRAGLAFGIAAAFVILFRSAKAAERALDEHD